MVHDPYRDFALVYDEWQKLYPRPFSLALAPRIRARIQKLGSPRPVLADLACGTGTFAQWWKQTHSTWTVYGTDRSPAMIAAARSDARAHARPKARPIAQSRNGAGRPSIGAPVFFVQDLRELALPEPAGVLTCLFDSLNHITLTSDLLRIFRRAHAALAPRGLFLFDLVDERAFAEVFTGTSILDGPDLYGGIETVFQERRGVGMGQASFTFFRRGGRGWRRINFDIRERRWQRKEIRDLLGRAGFERVRLERIDPYASRHFFVPRMFWAARRK